MSRSRSTRRSASRGGGARGGFAQQPWRPPRNPRPPMDVLDAEQLERIHDASMRVLEEIGVAFLLPEALDILAAAGADVDRASQVVRFDRALVAEALASAPQCFRLHARNPGRHLTVGGDHLNFATVGSAPNASDLERGRRPGSFADYCDFLRLGQSLNAVHLFTGYPVEPVDLPPQTRHLDCLRAFVTLTDKCWHGYSLGRARIRDALAIARLARGVDAERFAREPSLFSVINSSSPLRIDGPMLEGVIELARQGQVVVLTPFTLSGAMAPATIAGALAQQNAEALAGIAFAQIVRPGAPVVYGGFTSNVDMRSGSPAFGTPEYAQAALAGGQLARRYRLPYRSSNANASNAVDAQAAYESQMSLWPAVLGHANLVMHGAGWMEGGLTASFEKMVIDAEMLQMMIAFLDPFAVDDDALALDAIAEVGHGGHFFGAAHTLARYETAFNAPLVSDWSNFERWREAGSLDAAQRAHRIWRTLASEYEPPPIDGDAALAVDDYVERRKREGGAPAF